jgi:hypothetical protein
LSVHEDRSFPDEAAVAKVVAESNKNLASKEPPTWTVNRKADNVEEQARKLARTKSSSLIRPPITDPRTKSIQDTTGQVIPDFSTVAFPDGKKIQAARVVPRDDDPASIMGIGSNRVCSFYIFWLAIR